MNSIEVKGTNVLGVTAPTLTELKSRPCSIEELQAAIVQLAEIVNANGIDTAREINELQRVKENKQWRASL